MQIENHNKKYWRGHTPCVWNDSFKHHSYHYRYPDSHTMLIKAWQEQGYPEGITLNGAVCCLAQQIPEYALDLCQQLGWKDIGCQLFRMRQADILPVHQDHYQSYKKITGLDSADRIWRAVVFLEDWKSGHYFEMNGEAWTNWRAGDYAVWNSDVPHMAANLGIEPRYTLQMTGWI